MAFWLSLPQIRASNQYNAGNQTWSWNDSPNLGQNQGQSDYFGFGSLFKYSRILYHNFKCSILSREWKQHGKFPSAIIMLVGASALQILFMTAWLTKSHVYQHPHNHQWHKPSHRCRLPSAHLNLYFGRDVKLGETRAFPTDQKDTLAISKHAFKILFGFFILWSS